MAEPYMNPSPVSIGDDDKLKNTSNWRTSTSQFFRRGITEVVKDVERRVRDFSRVPLINGEPVQVLRYYEGQHYYTHHDFFDPERYASDEAVKLTAEYGAK